MVVLGILLIVIGILAILAGLFINDGSAELLGISMSAETLFVVGAVAGALVLWGFSLTKWGTKRGLAHRQERKELLKLQREQTTGPQPSGGDERTPPAGA